MTRPPFCVTADLSKSTAQPNKIAIVGGGWSGIACAVTLARQGIPVNLYESARQLGGRARRVDWNNLALDNGQHLMVGAYRETLELMEFLGSADQLERKPLELILPGFSLRLPRLPNPFHLGVGLLMAKGLRLQDKLAAVSFLHHLQALRFRLPVDCSVRQLLSRLHQPDNLIEKLWAPLCLAALNTHLEVASAQVFCNVLRDSLTGHRANSDLLLNRNNLGCLLPDAATDYLTRQNCRIHLGSKVESVTRVAQGFNLAGPEHFCEQVVLAPHPARLPALLKRLPEMSDISRQISELTWQPILTLWLQFAEAPQFSFPMLGLGDSRYPWAFERNDIAPGVVSMVMSAEGPHLHLPAEQLRDEYLALLARQIGPLPSLTSWKIIIEKRATFACIPDQQRPGNRTPIKGLYLAGDYTIGTEPTSTYPATIEGAVRSGVECARLILADRK